MFARILKFSVLVFLLIAPAVMAQEKVEVLSLKNRQVEEVIPIIRPLLRRNETVTGMRHQLIVRASPRTLREIKNLLEKIDTQLKNLRITVKQGTQSQLDELEARVDADIPIGETGRVIINSTSEATKGVIIKNGKGSVRARFLRKKSSLDEMNTQVVTTLEGNPAVIYFSRRIPQTKTFSAGNKVTQSIQFRDVRTGFTVLPRIRGDQVVLEISPQRSKIRDGEIETLGLDTVIRGRVGEWIELGGVRQSRNRQGSEIAGRNSSRQIKKSSVFVKVEVQ